MSTHSSDGANQRELIGLALALAAITALVLFLSDGTILFTRPLWVDEWLMVHVANRASPLAVLGDLAAGADGGASLVHLGHWLLRRLFGPLTPVTLRIVSFLCVMGALLLAYAVLRRRFGRDASIVGTLAAGSHPLIVGHAYDARFYGPWLLCCAWYAWLASRNQRPDRSRRDAVLLGVAAVLMSTVHFYGIITLGLMTAGAVASYGRRWRDGLRAMAPAGAGVAALAIVVPLAIAQREAYSIPSFLPDFTAAQLRAVVGTLWFSLVPLLAAIGLVIAILIGVRRDGGAGTSIVARRAAEDAGIGALMSLAVVPLALGLLSLFGQPSMHQRYAIATLLAWAPWTALAIELLGRWPGRVFRVLLVAMWFVSYTEQARLKHRFAFSVAYAQGELDRALSAGIPVIFESTHVMYPVLGANLGDPRTALLELPDSTFDALFPDSTRRGQLNRGTRLERDLAQAHFRRWGFPRLAPQGQLDTTPRFILLAPEVRLPIGLSSLDQYAGTMFPRHRVTRLSSDLALLELVPADSISK